MVPVSVLKTPALKRKSLVDALAAKRLRDALNVAAADATDEHACEEEAGQVQKPLPEEGKDCPPWPWCADIESADVAGRDSALWPELVDLTGRVLFVHEGLGDDSPKGSTSSEEVVTTEMAYRFLNLKLGDDSVDDISSLCSDWVSVCSVTSESLEDDEFCVVEMESCPSTISGEYDLGLRLKELDEDFTNEQEQIGHGATSRKNGFDDRFSAPARNNFFPESGAAMQHIFSETSPKQSLAGHHIDKAGCCGQDGTDDEDSWTPV